MGGCSFGVELVVSYHQPIWTLAGEGESVKDMLGGCWVFLEKLRHFQFFSLRGDEQEAKPSYWSGSGGTL